MKLKDVTFDSQRNGIAGEGFFQAHFTYEQTEYRDEDVKLIAVIFDDLDYIREYVASKTVMNPKCGIVHTTDPTSHWRGDNFAGYLYPLLLEWWDAKYPPIIDEKEAALTELTEAADACGFANWPENVRRLDAAVARVKELA